MVILCHSKELLKPCCNVLMKSSNFRAHGVGEGSVEVSLLDAACLVVFITCQSSSVLITYLWFIALMLLKEHQLLLGCS